jgi:small subunit ribosomal protein S20
VLQPYRTNNIPRQDEFKNGQFSYSSVEFDRHLNQCLPSTLALSEVFFGGIKLANIKSAIKRNKQNEKKRVRNRVYRGEARTYVARARTAIQGKDAEAAKTATLEAIAALDKAAQKGVVHKNNAARRKSRLMKLLAQQK